MSVLSTIVLLLIISALLVALNEYRFRALPPDRDEDEKVETNSKVEK